LRKTVSIRFNRDQTITVRVGRQVEHVGIAGKEKAQVFDAVKWAVISKGLHLADADLAEILWRKG
jgi:hypothetical protein